MNRSAVFDQHHKFRYKITRVWDPNKITMAWVMLNPSLADMDRDDPTIRRVIGFTQREGFGGFTVVNLFGIISPKPSKSGEWTRLDVGRDNDAWIKDAFSCGQGLGRIVFAWGVHAPAWRVKEVVALLPSNYAFCLGTTQGGHPRHPLYLRADAPYKKLEF